MVNDLKKLLLEKTKIALAIEKWNYSKNIEDVSVCTFDSDPILVRGIGTVKMSVKDTLGWINTLDVEKRKKWDPLCRKVERVRDIDNHFATFMTYASPLPLISPRTALLFGTVYLESDGSVIISNMSIPSDHHLFQDDESGFVRSHVHIGVWKLDPVDSKTTKITAITQASFKGWIPEWASTQVKLTQPETIIKLSQIALQ